MIFGLILFSGAPGGTAPGRSIDLYACMGSCKSLKSVRVRRYRKKLINQMNKKAKAQGVAEHLKEEDLFFLPECRVLWTMKKYDIRCDQRRCFKI